MAPFPGVPAQPKSNRKELDIVLCESLDSLSTRFHEISRVDEELRKMQAKWLEQAGSLLKGQPDSLPSAFAVIDLGQQGSTLPTIQEASSSNHGGVNGNSVVADRNHEISKQLSATTSFSTLKEHEAHLRAQAVQASMSEDSRRKLDDWVEVVEDIGIISPVWVALFLLYITFTLFAVLNVVTGVFCQSAIESVQDDKELAAMQLMANKEAYIEALDKLFDEIDKDRSDFITVHEFEESLEKEKVKAYFLSLDMSIPDAWALFKLLDSDSSGCIDKEEFVMGCIQFKGGASAVDIAKMAYENGVTFNMLENSMRQFRQDLSCIRVGIRDICGSLRLKHDDEFPTNQGGPSRQTSPWSPFSLASRENAPTPEESLMSPMTSNSRRAKRRAIAKATAKGAETSAHAKSAVDGAECRRRENRFDTRFSVYGLSQRQRTELELILVEDKSSAISA